MFSRIKLLLPLLALVAALVPSLAFADSPQYSVSWQDPDHTCQFSVEQVGQGCVIGLGAPVSKWEMDSQGSWIEVSRLNPSCYAISSGSYRATFDDGGSSYSVTFSVSSTGYVAPTSSASSGNIANATSSWFTWLSVVLPDFLLAHPVIDLLGLAVGIWVLALVFGLLRTRLD